MHWLMHDALHKSNNHLIVELHVTAMYAPNIYKNIGKQIIHFYIKDVAVLSHGLTLGIWSQINNHSHQKQTWSKMHFCAN